MKIIALTLLMVLSCSLAAQQKDTAGSGLQFSSVLLGGVLAGQSGMNGLVQTINGIQYRKTGIGAGVGLDYYLERTVPVFLDVRRDLFNSRKTPFAYADGGYHFAWVKDDHLFESDQKGGWFYEAGVGYKFPFIRKSQWLLSAGYSHKPYSKRVDVMPWSSVWPRPSESFQTYDYTLRRVVIKAGIAF